jgi:hypothetical protein
MAPTASSFAALPPVPDDEAWLSALKTGGALKVDANTVTSGMRAALAERTGLFELPAKLIERMEAHADSLDEPVPQEFFKLREAPRTEELLGSDGGSRHRRWRLRHSEAEGRVHHPPERDDLAGPFGVPDGTSRVDEVVAGIPREPSRDDDGARFGNSRWHAPSGDDATAGDRFAPRCWRGRRKPGEPSVLWSRAFRLRQRWRTTP